MLFRISADFEEQIPVTLKFLRRCKCYIGEGDCFGKPSYESSDFAHSIFRVFDGF